MGNTAKVVNCVQAKTRYGPKLVLNCKLLSDNSEVAVWSNDLGNKVFRSKHKGDIVELIESDKGSYTVLERDKPSRNIGGAGLKSVNEVLGGSPQSNGNGTVTTTQQVASNVVENYLDNDLGLPELLTDRQKQDLKKRVSEKMCGRKESWLA